MKIVHPGALARIRQTRQMP